MEQHVGGSRRAHAEERPDDARRRHRGLEHVGLEPLIEKVHGAHRHELDLVVLIAARQTTKALQQEEQLLESSRIERGRIRRQHAEDRSNEATHLDHRLPVFVVGLGVETRVPRDLATRLRVVVHAPQVVTVRHRRERAVEREDLEPVRRQIELANDLGTKQRDDVRADGEVKALEDLLSDRGAAEDVAAFEDQHLASGSGQVGGGGQAVVPAADDDGVVSHPAAILGQMLASELTPKLSAI